MNPCQDYLFNTAFRQPPDFPQHILLTPAAHPAPGIRYNTIGTKLITAVLDFDISPRMGRQRRLSADTKSPSANACRIPIFRAAPHVRTGFSTDPLLILRPKQRHLLIRLLPANIHYRTPGKRLLLPHITAGFPPAGLLPLCKKGLQNLHNILLPVIPTARSILPSSNASSFPACT